MSKPIIFGDRFIEAEAHSAPWQKTHGTYLAGRAAVDEADALAVTMERKWGAGRLRLVVPAGLREKFDRQRYKFNHAIWHGELEEVRMQARRMVAAWKALDATATASGAQASDPDVWEVVLEDGSVAAIVQDNSAAHHVIANSDRRLRVYTLAEIGRLLSSFPALAAIKDEFPGASVERVNEPRDPLDAIDRTSGDLDDEVPAF